MPWRCCLVTYWIHCKPNVSNEPVLQSYSGKKAHYGWVRICAESDKSAAHRRVGALQIIFWHSGEYAHVVLRDLFRFVFFLLILTKKSIFLWKKLPPAQGYITMPRSLPQWTLNTARLHFPRLHLISIK